MSKLFTDNVIFFHLPPEFDNDLASLINKIYYFSFTTKVTKNDINILLL